MTKFFRGIRYNLMEKKPPAGEEGKTGKYLKYAIGEIVLVVIGILIALQINNWNEHRKAKISERELYDRVLMDMQIDEDRINNYLTYYKNDQLMYHHIYQDAHGLLPGDSLIDFSTFRSARVFNLTIEANYSKYIKEITKDNIRKKMDDYFKQESNVYDALKQLTEFKEAILKPYLSKHGINDTKELFNNYQLYYYDLREKNILSYSRIKEQYGTEALDQLLFDLGIKTSWALTACNDILKANKELQLELTKELRGKNSDTEK